MKQWWIGAATTMLIIVVFSEPPRVWLWLVLFVLIMLYGWERSIKA